MSFVEDPDEISITILFIFRKIPEEGEMFTS